MKNLESRLAIVDRDIRKLENVAVATTDESSALLTQLRKLREDIKTTAKKDYVNTQNEVLKTFRTLMEQLASLSFFASEAEEDTRGIEKSISQLNKIKSSISEGLLGLADDKENKESNSEAPEANNEEKVESSAQMDVKDFVEQSNGTYFENYELWYTAVTERNLKIDIKGNIVSAIDENGDCLGKYDAQEMEGCLFNNIEDYDRAFEEESDDDDDDDEDAIEEEYDD